MSSRDGPHLGRSMGARLRRTGRRASPRPSACGRIHGDSRDIQFASQIVSEQGERCGAPPVCRAPHAPLLYALIARIHCILRGSPSLIRRSEPAFGSIRAELLGAYLRHASITALSSLAPAVGSATPIRMSQASLRYPVNDPGTV